MLLLYIFCIFSTAQRKTRTIAVDHYLCGMWSVSTWMSSNNPDLCILTVSMQSGRTKILQWHKNHGATFITLNSVCLKVSLYHSFEIEK